MADDAPDRATHPAMTTSAAATLRRWCDVETRNDWVDDVDVVALVQGSLFQSVQVRSGEPPGTSAAGRQRRERSRGLKRGVKSLFGGSSNAGRNIK